VKVSYTDQRSEEMQARQRRDDDQPVEADGTIAVRDIRDVTIEWEDTDEIYTLPTDGDATFSVKTMEIRWIRSWSMTGNPPARRQYTGWQAERVCVRGPQVKDSGKRGPARKCSADYPLHVEGEGYVPVPEWMSRLATAYSPVTGKTFLYPEKHTYGTYSFGYEPSPGLEALLYPGM
jgi:hypothetical protein